MEEWKDIPGYGGLYQASTEGRIRSQDQEVLFVRGGTQVINRVKGRVIGGKGLSRKGYLRVNLNGKVVSAHRIIAFTFFGPSDLQVNHINGIKTDNRVVNLEYVTNQENRDHAVKMGLHATGPRTKLPEVVEMAEVLKALGNTQREVGEIMGLSQQTVSYLLRKA